MKKKLLLLLTLLSITLRAEQGTPFEGPSYKREPQLLINNRPLAKINGKTISLIDVVKRMDLFLYEYDPNLTLAVPEKIQFYLTRWESTLSDMIFNQLAILDAKQKKIEVSEGDIREELEERFGPNVMNTLEKINLGFDEAKELVEEELLTRQVMWYKVHSKVLQTITPQVVKTAYQEYVKKNPPAKHWAYKVLTVRGKEETACESIAKHAYALLTSQGKSFEEVAEELKKEGEETTLTVSDQLEGDSTNISTQHLSVLKNLEEHSFSEPVSQVSRFDHNTVTRIFYLESTKEKKPAEFETMHDQLKNRLLNETAEAEKNAYYKTLKKRFGYDKQDIQLPLPEGYQPFVLY